MRWVGHIACMGEKRNEYRDYWGGGGPEGKRPLGRSRRRLEGNVKMVLKGIGLEGVE
jgi:hypothetical protein